MKSLKKTLSILLFISFVFNLKSQDDFSMGSCPQVDYLITCLFKEASNPQELICGICNIAQGLQFGNPGQRNFAKMIVNRTLDLTTQYQVNYIDILLEACRCVLNDSGVVSRYTEKPDLCKGQRNPLCLICNFLQELKLRGITLYTPAADGKNLIMHLSDNGCDQDIIKLLIAHYPNINIHKHENEDPSFFDYSANQSKIPFLSQAIERYAPLEVIENIIKLGHEVNYGYEDCDPPLIQAMKIYKQSFFKYDYVCNLIKLLLDNGADPYFVGKDGQSSLFFATNSFGYPVWDGLFLESGIDVDSMDQTGGTLLHRIINKRGSIDRVLDAIAKFNININSRDFNGNTILHLLARRDTFYYPETERFITVLLENGADTEIENKRNEKPRKLSKNRKIKWLLRDRQGDYVGRFGLFQNGVKWGCYQIGLID